MFPMLYKVNQMVDDSFEPDPSGSVRREINRSDLSGRFTPGQTMAVAVGSRGIQGIVGMVAAMVSSLKMLGLKPFIIPAMGSHGGATSDGQQQVADLTTRRVIDTLDMKANYTNALTTGLWAAARLPIALENDRVALETALSRIHDPGNVRMACITNTLFWETFWASEALLTELRSREDIEIDETPLAFRFSSEERLLPFSATGHEPGGKMG